MARLLAVLVSSTLIALVPVADVAWASDGRVNQPDAWPSAGSQQPALVRTPLNASGCLMTDSTGANLIEGALGGPPQPCPASGIGAVPLPISNTPQSFVVASRLIPSLPAGTTLDAAGVIEVSTPDFETDRPDALHGRLVLATSPAATTGAAITAFSGGAVDWPNLQHHLSLSARGSYRARTALGPMYVNFVLTTYTPKPCARANQCYDPCKEDGSTVSSPPYDRVCVNAGYSLLSAQLFRPAQRGQPLMAIDPMVSAPATPTTLSYGLETPVWVSPPISGLASGQVITAHADLTFTWDANTGGGPLPQCDPNVWTRITLVNQSTHRAVRLTPASPALLTQASPSTNLTVGEPWNTLSPYGAVQLDANSDWSGTWNVVIDAGAALDAAYGCHDDPTSVAGGNGASDAAAFRFRAATAGEQGWQEEAVSSMSALAGSVSSSPTTIYTSPGFPAGISPTQVIDVAGAAELQSNSCATAIMTGPTFGGQPIDAPAATNAPANTPGYPPARLGVTAGGAQTVPYNGGATYSGTVSLTAQGQTDSVLCVPAGPVGVRNPGGGVYVESYWPTTVVAHAAAGAAAAGANTRPWRSPTPRLPRAA